jgi:hypothetical protein
MTRSSPIDTRLLSEIGRRISYHILVGTELLTAPKIKGGMGFRELELFNLALLGKHG